MAGKYPKTPPLGMTSMWQDAHKLMRMEQPSVPDKVSDEGSDDDMFLADDPFGKKESQSQVTDGNENSKEESSGDTASEDSAVGQMEDWSLRQVPMAEFVFRCKALSGKHHLVGYPTVKRAGTSPADQQPEDRAMFPTADMLAPQQNSGSSSASEESSTSKMFFPALGFPDRDLGLGSEKLGALPQINPEVRNKVNFHQDMYIFAVS